MRISTPVASRPQYYDRNAITEVQHSELSAGPHATTARAVYTVPAGKKAYIELAENHIRRNTAASAAARATGECAIFISGGNSGGFVQTILWASENTVGDRDDNIIGFTTMLIAADVFQAQTSDGSTGGDISYFQKFKYTEFEA